MTDPDRPTDGEHDPAGRGAPSADASGEKPQISDGPADGDQFAKRLDAAPPGDVKG